MSSASSSPVSFVSGSGWGVLSRARLGRGAIGRGEERPATAALLASRELSLGSCTRRRPPARLLWL